MAIPSRQIGWSQESNILWQISKQLEKIAQLGGKPSFQSYPSLGTFPVPGKPDVIYLALDTNQIYYWDGAAYVELSSASATPPLGVYTFTGIPIYNNADIGVTTDAYFQLDNVVYGPYNVYNMGGAAINQPYITNLVFNEEAISGINLNGCSLLVTASYPNLIYIQGGSIGFSNNTTCTSISAPLLKYMETGIGISNLTSLTSVNFSSLVRVSAISFTGNTVLTSVSFPALKNLMGGNFSMASNANLTSISLPLLISVVGNISIVTTPITSLLLPSISTVGGSISVTNLSSLTTVSLGSGLIIVFGNVSFSGCALNQASVDNVLVRLAALDGTGGTIAYSSRTVTLNGGTNATPSATGLAAKAVLVARGCTVTNN